MANAMHLTNIIPAPISSVQHEGLLQLDESVAITCSEDCLGIGQLVASYLRDRLAIAARSRSLSDGPEPGVQTLSLQCSSESVPELQGMPLAHEGYVLRVTPEGVSIRSIQPAGVFYGVQSLLQLLPALRSKATGLAPIQIPALTIVDAPRFLWRGVLLDCGRHYFPLPFLKKFLDIMALQKLNRFHWHLCEDQGWRIEVMKYPQLTNVGAWRGDRDGVPRYGGFYTQDEMREVVSYAAERFIEVVPEVELPGHCCAALASYPHLGCTGQVTQTPIYWGVHEDVYCAGKEETFDFLEDVLKEVIDIFPSKYLHIGGDECPKVRWAECERCQQRIAEEGLADEFELQSWFVARIGAFLAQRGRQLIGWDEILEGTADGRRLPPDAIVMSWRGISGGVRAARAGHQVIMTPTSHCYLDYRQSLRAGEPGAWYALLPLEMVYAFDPVPPRAPDPPPPEDDASDFIGPAPMSPNGAGGYSESSSDMDCVSPSSGEPPSGSSAAGASGVLPDADDASASVATEPPPMPQPDAEWALTAAEAQLVLGGQANVWTEYIPTEECCEYMTHPRLSAMAEVLWSPAAAKSYPSFLARLPSMLFHLDAMGLRYRALG